MLIQVKAWKITSLHSTREVLSKQSLSQYSTVDFFVGFCVNIRGQC